MPKSEWSFSDYDENGLAVGDFESTDMSFEKIGEMFGETFVDAVLSLAPTSSIEDAVRDIRAIADEHQIDLADALLGTTVASNAEIDSAIAMVGFRDLLTSDQVSAPDVLAYDEELSDVLGDDRLSDSLKAIASVAPDSLCARVSDCVQQRNALYEERDAVENNYLDAVTDAEEREDYDTMREEQGAYEHAMQAFDDKENALNDVIEQLRGTILEKLDMVVRPDEQDIVAGLLDAEEKNDAAGFDEYKQQMEAYVSEHPDSILASFSELREQYMTAKESVDFSSGFEEKHDLADKYYSYNSICRDIMCAKPVEAPNPENDSVDTEGSSAVQVEKHQTDYDIRADARCVVDYCVAERIYENGKGYLSFNEGKDLSASVHAKFDDMERMAKGDNPLSKEFSSIVNELDSLGTRNGDIDHDNRILELESRKGELTDYAGAVIGSTLDKSTAEQERVIDKYCQAEKLCEKDPNSQIAVDNVQFYRDALKEYASHTSAERGGVAAQFEDMLNVRDTAEARVSMWEDKYNAAGPDEAKDISDGLFELRFERDKAQYAIDSRFYEVRICRDGIERFGIIDLPPVIEQKQDIEATPDNTQGKEAAFQEDKTPYELAKEKYESIQGRYLFRNTFVCAARLSLNIEAYRAGEDGVGGHPISGGDIAMNILELSRSNLFESVFEVAIREYFDEKFPAQDNVDIEDAKIQLRWDTEVETSKDFTQEVTDTGLVEKEFDPEHHHSDNPEFGHYMRADMTQPSKYNDIGMQVYDCGSKDSVFTVTTGNVDSDGKADVMAVPPLRLVTMDNSRYLVDPFGQTIRSNFTTDSKDQEKNLEISRPYFAALDISATPQGQERLEAMAAHRHTDVESCKQEIVAQCKKEYADSGIVEIREHEAYIKEKLLPDMLSDLSECKERISFLDDVKSVFTHRVEQPSGYDSAQDVENFKGILKIIDDGLGKLGVLESGLTTRIERLVSTVEMYDSVKTIYRSSGSEDSKFETVVYATSHSHGKIDNPYFGVGYTDLQSIDLTLEACGFQTENRLEDVFAGRGWPEESNTSFDWIGAKHDDIAPDAEEVAMRADLREAVGPLYPDFEERWPGLIDKSDRKFDIEKFNAKEILIDAGVVSVDKEAMIAEAKKGDTSENAQLQRLGLYAYEHMTEQEYVDYMNEQPVIPTLKDIPTEEQIQRARDNIARFAFGSPIADGLGTREVTPDFDWNTVRPREIIQDGNRFWVRPEGEQKHILMSIDQTAAYLHGPLDKEDVSTALDKYLSLSKDAASTFSFATDFLDINKYRVSPETVLDAYSEKLQDFVSGDDGKVERYHVETMADCLASLKEQIVECYADKVSDKIDAVIRDAVSDDKNERISTFVDKLTESFKPVINKVSGSEVDMRKVTLSESVSGKLEVLLEKGAGESELGVITEIAKALDAVFEGYSDMLKDVIEAVNKVDADTDHIASDDAAFIAEEDGDVEDRVDADSEREENDDIDRSDLTEAIESIDKSIQDVLEGLNDIDHYSEEEVEPADIDAPDSADKVDRE